MTVQELIDKLQAIEDKDLQVFTYNYDTGYQHKTDSVDLCRTKVFPSETSELYVCIDTK